MLRFRLFLIIELYKNKLFDLINEKVLQFKQELANNLILESILDVNNLKNIDLHQTEQNKENLDKFIEEFDKLSQQLQFLLIEKLSKPTNGKSYIENNNEVKLILIYQNNKNNNIGQEAYNKVILNQTNLFKNVAAKKVKGGSLTSDQAADYIQLMFLTLCGGGYYNERNNRKYSLDAYDPYSGVPFAAFVMSKVILPAFNKFQASLETSIATDYAKQRDGVEVNSANSKEIKSLLENIIDSDDIFNITDKKIKIDILNKILIKNLNLPQKLQLNEKEKEFLKLYLNSNLGKLDIARKLGYENNPSPNFSRLKLSVTNKLKNSIKYLPKIINISKEK